MGLFGAKVIYWSQGGDLCRCCYRIREDFVHFGLALFDGGPGLCTSCWRRGHQHRSQPCVDVREIVAGRHPNEAVKLNGRKLLWAQVLEAALEDGMEETALKNLEALPPAWLEQRFPSPATLLRRIFTGPDLLKLARTLPHPRVWSLRFESARLRQEVDGLAGQIAVIQRETEALWDEIRARQAQSG